MTQTANHPQLKSSSSNGSGRRRSDREFSHRNEQISSRSDAINWRSIVANTTANNNSTNTNTSSNSTNSSVNNSKPASMAWTNHNSLDPALHSSNENSLNTSYSTNKLPLAKDKFTYEEMDNGDSNQVKIRKKSNCLLSTNEFLFNASCYLIGMTVEVQTKDGNCYRGIFHTMKEDMSVQMNMVRLCKTMAKGEEDELVKEASRKPPIKSKIFKNDQLVQLIAKDVSMGSDASSNGKYIDDNGHIFTDKKISRGRHRGEERELKPWIPEEEDEQTYQLHLSSEAWNKDNSNGRHWDQFKTNKALFGVESTFDENLYTTRLEKQSKEIEMEASRIAREIESQNTLNFHLAEERGQVIPSQGEEDMDEETRFSSVIRNNAREDEEEDEEEEEGEEYDHSNNFNDETFGDHGFSSPPNQNSMAMFPNKAESFLSSSSSLPGQHPSDVSILMGQEESNALLAISEKRTDHLRLRLGPMRTGNGNSPYMSPVSKRSPLLSPMVGDAPTIVALNLDHSCPQVPDDVYRDFHEFKMSGSAKKGNKREKSSLMELKSFSESLRERTPIEPRSPISRQETPTSRLVHTEFSAKPSSPPDSRLVHSSSPVSDTLHSAAISLSLTSSTSDPIIPIDSLMTPSSFQEPSSLSSPSLSPAAEIPRSPSSFPPLSTRPTAMDAPELVQGVEGEDAKQGESQSQSRVESVGLDVKPSNSVGNGEERKMGIDEKGADVSLLDSSSVAASSSSSTSSMFSSPSPSTSQSKSLSSTLNPNAKEFRLNPNAKIFTPNFAPTANSHSTSAAPTLPGGIPRTFSSGNVPMFMPGGMSPLALSPTLSMQNAMMSQQMMMTGPGMVPSHQQGQMASSPFNPSVAGFVPPMPPSVSSHPSLSGNYPPPPPLSGSLSLQQGMKVSSHSPQPQPHPPPPPPPFQHHQQQQMMPQGFPPHQTIRGFNPNQNSNNFMQQQQQQQVVFAQNQMVYLQSIPQPFVPHQQIAMAQQSQNQKIRGSPQGQFPNLQQQQAGNQAYFHGPNQQAMMHPGQGGIGGMPGQLNMPHHPRGGHPMGQQGASGPVPNLPGQHGPNGRGNMGK